MKRLKYICLATLIILSVVLSQIGCGSSDKKPLELNNKVQNESEIQTSKSFSFETTLKEETLYPKSVGRNFYVATSGDDNNDGLTENTAIKTLDKANEINLVGGDTINFRRGDKFKGQLLITKSGNDDNPITITSYIEKGSKKTKFPVLYGEYEGVILLRNVSNVVVKEVGVTVNSPTRGLASPSTLQAGIKVLYNQKGEKHKNIYIVNNIVEGNGVDNNAMGIAINSIQKNFVTCDSEVLTNAVVRYNTVRNVGRSGIHAHGWLEESDNNNYNNSKFDLFKNIIFNNNTVYNVGQIGMYIGCSTDSEINRNIVYDTGKVPFATTYGEGECGIMAIGSKNMDIMYNETYNNYDANVNCDAMGIDIDWNTDNIDVAYNHCYSSMGAGIGTMANQNSKIRSNRIEENQCLTNLKGQINIGDFTARYGAVENDMHAVTNLEVSKNIVVYSGNKTDMILFNTIHLNGDILWENNKFSENHIVSNNAVDEFFINVVEETPWREFSGNKYYDNNQKIFKVYDDTKSIFINPEASKHTGDYIFSEWQKRDTNSTFEKLNEKQPKKIDNLNATYIDGKINLEWQGVENAWHYNIYLLKAKEDIDYTKLLGETESNKFEYEITNKGEYYVVVYPENNLGKYGEPIKICITV